MNGPNIVSKYNVLNSVVVIQDNYHNKKIQYMSFMGGETHYKIICCIYFEDGTIETDKIFKQYKSQVVNWINTQIRKADYPGNRITIRPITEKDIEECKSMKLMY